MLFAVRDGELAIPVGWLVFGRRKVTKMIQTSTKSTSAFFFKSRSI